MNKRILIRTMVIILVAVITTASFGASGTFSGRIWNDINRDGIQDVGEPGMSNFPISVDSQLLYYYGHSTGCYFTVYYTDLEGYYNFSFSNSNGTCMAPAFSYTNYNFVVNFIPNEGYGWSPYNAVSNDAIDSDFEFPWYVVTNDAVDLSNRDLGVFRLNVAISFEAKANGVPHGTPLYVTNGTPVTFTYHVQNIGETRLSHVDIYETEQMFFELVSLVECPDSIGPMEIRSFATQQVVHVSFTNETVTYAFPVSAYTCNLLPESNPVVDSIQTIVIVVTNNPLDFADGDIFPNAWEMQYGFDPLNSNAPDINSDGDWMTNYEEYLTGTNPTNPASYFPNITLAETSPDAVSMMVSTSLPDRVYNVWRSTNLLNDPQSWSLLPPEQTGTSGALMFSITNDLPGAHYRTGVRLP